MKYTNVLFGAVLASQLAQEIGLPVGNFWEPAFARNIVRQLEGGKSREQTKKDIRHTLGVDKETQQ